MWKNVGTGAVQPGPNGGAFTIAQRGDAPTIETDFYIFFGEVSVTMQAAPGQGIVSSLVLESDDLDEVDWEALGGDNTQIETNYFGKGDTSTYNRFTWVPVSSPQTTFHTYTVTWTQQAITWSIDGSNVRTLLYNDAQGGSRFPQTPMRVRLGIWAGGDPSNAPGTIQWAGGPTNYADAPFTMYIKSVDITNYNPAKSYTYGDNSGSWQSIVINDATSGGSSPSPNHSGGNGKPDPKPDPKPTTSTTTTSSTTSSSTESTESTTHTTKNTSTKTSTHTSSTTKSTPSSGSSSSSAAKPSSSGSSHPHGSSTPGSGSGSHTSTGSSSNTSSAPTPSSAPNAAGHLAAKYLAPLSLVGMAAFLQL